MRQKSTMGNKAPCPSAILMAMRMRWSKACGIARCSKTGATLDAPGTAIRRLLALYCPGSCQGNNHQNNNQTIHPLCWVFWWQLWCSGTIPRTLPGGGGSGLHHKPLDAAIQQALAPITSIGHIYPCFVDVFPLSTLWKQARSKRMAPVTIGVWYIQLKGSI